VNAFRNDPIPNALGGTDRVSGARFCSPTAWYARPALERLAGDLDIEPARTVSSSAITESSTLYRSGRKRRRNAREATAFVPTHVTGFQRPSDDDPDESRLTRRGTDADGRCRRNARASDGDDRRTRWDGNRCRPVATVLETLDARPLESGELPTPARSGFGVSGAMALGTALAANRVFDRKLDERTRHDRPRCRGSRPGRDSGMWLPRPTAASRSASSRRPSSGELDAIPARARVEYISFGERSTADVLSGDTEALTAAGKGKRSRGSSRNRRCSSPVRLEAVRARCRAVGDTGLGGDH